MSTIAIAGGTFSTEPHEYRDEQGRYIPSITQVLQLCGFSTFNGISRDVLEAAAERGSKIHAICWSLAKYDDYDPSWSDETLEPYIAAYKKAIKELGFVADKDWVERPIISEIAGMKFAATPDCIGTRHPHPWVIELKTASTESKSWAIQTMAQAIARFGVRAESAKRMALMLRSDGKYRCCVHENAAYDKSTFLAGLTCVYWRINAGQQLYEAR